MTSGVVLARTGASYRVHTDQGEVTATLRGRLKRRDDDRVVEPDRLESYQRVYEEISVPSWSSGRRRAR